ncbi:hypothetical protein VSX61_16900 [Brenneria populi subsp. brevivirga]|uniref:hypothetical protein n=1 Tax=Brenneria populi TaxID=1505588 RepID=UPI002E18ED4B|nr:hypothetical protein [Brenneria populi subsp. brevivirga]
MDDSWFAVGLAIALIYVILMPIAVLFMLTSAANLLDEQIAWSAGRTSYLPLLNPLEAGMAQTTFAPLPPKRRITSKDEIE